MMNLRVKVRDLNEFGQGVGVLEGDGRVVFVDGALPGEVVEVLDVRKLAKHALGSLGRIIEMSSDRIESDCSVFGECGGCTLRHLRYEAQLSHKRAVVRNALLRIGGKELGERAMVLPVKGMTDPTGYRCKIAFSVGWQGQEPKIGFFRRASHDTVFTPRCHIEPDAARCVRRACEGLIRGWIDTNRAKEARMLVNVVVRTGWNTGDVMVVLVVRAGPMPDFTGWFDVLSEAVKSALQLGSGKKSRLVSLWLNEQGRGAKELLGRKQRLLGGTEYYEETLGQVVYRITPRAFFQVNPLQAEVVYNEVLQRLHLQAGAKLVDLYCGSGAIGLYVAREGRRVGGVQVIGVDNESQGIGQARDNAERNGLSRECRFYVQDCEKWLRDVVRTGEGVDCAVVDPPRGGLSRGLIDTLNELGMRGTLQRVVYVSCNPATLARDLERLGAVWQVGEVQPVDMFPFTSHVECVAGLRCKPAS